MSDHVVTGPTASITNAPATTTGSAQCPPGSLLIGGGYLTNTTTVKTVDTYADYPSTPGVAGIWTVTIGADGNLSYTPYAICSP